MAEIRRDLTGSKGSYVLATDHGDAILTYSILSPKRVIADHTEVPHGVEGQGIGLRLVERLIADVRAEGSSIVPLCPFVNAQHRKHPEWAPYFDV